MISFRTSVQKSKRTDKKKNKDGKIKEYTYEQTRLIVPTRHNKELKKGQKVEVKVEKLKGEEVVK